MIRKSDIQWWVLEAKEHPAAAPTIVEELAQRLIELDAENERLRNEIIRLQQRAPTTADSAEVSALRRKVATLQTLLSSEASTEPMVIFLSDRLHWARMPLAQAQHLAREGRPVTGKQTSPGLRHLLLARPADELLLFTSKGRALKALSSDIPWLAEDDDQSMPENQQLASDERLTTALVVAKPPRFWTVVTRRGHVRQFLRIDLERRLAKGEQLITSLFRNDAPVAAVNGDEGDLLVLTRWGKGVRFPQRAIEAQGSVALELEPDDEVVAALSLPSDTQILIVTASGYAVRRDTSQLPARSRPGGAGKALIQTFDVLGAFPSDSQANLLYLTYSGKLALAPLAEIPLHQRSDKGTRVRVFDRDPAVAVVLVPGTS